MNVFRLCMNACMNVFPLYNKGWGSINLRYMALEKPVGMRLPAGERENFSVLYNNAFNIWGLRWLWGTE